MPSATSDKGLSLKTIKYELIFSPIYGVFGSLGLYCFLNYAAIAAFHERSKHPYLEPFCVLAGLASFCICVAALAGHVYCYTSKKNKTEKTSSKTVAAKIVFMLVLIFLFFVSSAFLWEPLRMLVSDMIKAAEVQALQ